MVEFIFVVLNRVCIPDTFREAIGVFRPPKIKDRNNYSQPTKVAYKNRTADGLFRVDVPTLWYPLMILKKVSLHLTQDMLHQTVFLKTVYSKKCTDPNFSSVIVQTS